MNIDFYLHLLYLVCMTASKFILKVADTDCDSSKSVCVVACINNKKIMLKTFRLNYRFLIKYCNKEVLSYIFSALLFSIGINPQNLPCVLKTKDFFITFQSFAS